jgi:hypothetical protein
MQPGERPQHEGPRSVRLPLVVGTSALWSIFTALLAMTPLLFVVGTASDAWTAYRDGGKLPTRDGVIANGVFALFVLAIVGGELWRAWRRRAADVVIDDRGLSIDGGPLHGRSFAWTEIDRGSARVDTSYESPLLYAFKLWGKKQREVHTLSLRVRGQHVVLGRVDRKVEHASLDDLALTLRSTRLGLSADAPTPSYAGPLHCSGCGAPLVPTAGPTCTCRFCGTVTAQSAELRQRIGAAEELARARTRATSTVAKLVGQPGARRINTMLLAALVLGALGYPTSVLAIAYQLEEGSLRFSLVNDLLMVPWAVAAVVAVFARARLVDRLALPLLTVGFGARRGPRGVLVCRECGGPLPDVTRRALVRCVFCGADNVLGVDLTKEVTAAHAEARGLEVVLARRRRDRLVWLGPGTVVVCFLAFWTAGKVREGFTPNRYTHYVQSDGRIDLEISPTGRAVRGVSASPTGLVLVAFQVDGHRWALGLVDPGRANERWDPPVVVEDREIRATTFVGTTHAAYVTEREDGTAALRYVPLAGRAEPVTLLEGEALEHPSGSPSGRQIVIGKRASGTWGLHVVSVDGDQDIRLRDGRMPAWHPVKMQIAFVEERDGSLDLFEMRIEEPGKVFPVLKPNTSDEVDPAYSPCGEALVFATNDGWRDVRAGSPDKTFNLWAIPNDGPVMKLTHGNAVARSPAWTPRRIWYESDILDPPWLRGLQVPGAFLGELYAGAECPTSLDKRR